MDVIKREAHISLLRCIFLVIGKAKKKEKGTSVVARWLYVKAWETEW